MIGRVLSQRYEILERVGEGALFQTFKARDRTMNRIVAIKVPQSLLIRDEAFVRAMKSVGDEYSLVAHPGIARVFSADTESDPPYLVTEFVRGINLKERIRRIAPFTLSVAVDFAIAIAEALQAAHAAGMVHGDIRPQNVIVTAEGAVKVTDFGTNRLCSASQDAQGQNLFRSMAYQAPEIALGARPSPSSDIYALGAVLYEMLTGSVPYNGDNPVSVALKHQNDPVPAPQSINPGVPRSLQGIIAKAMQKRPETRYASAADVLNDLKNVRDALRFGKPLSWAPEIDDASGPSSGAGRVKDAAAYAETPVARMSATSTVPDDRLSPYLKFGLLGAFVLLVVVVTAGVSMWMAAVAKPPEQKFPSIEGMKIEEARELAAKVNVRLIEHEAFNESRPAGVVFRAEMEPGRLIAAGRSVNVWVSKGSRNVWVPKVVGMSAEQAEKTLREAGLVLGTVDRGHDDKVELDHVVVQNPSSGKRVPRDSAVNLMLSDGPKNPPPPTAEENPETPAANPADTSALEPKIFNLQVTIPRDGRGVRRVRVEYQDAQGVHTPIDEEHAEGDEFGQRVPVFGKTITVRIYYGDDPKPVSERTRRLDAAP
jgi:serine/threonine-protein kinase